MKQETMGSIRRSLILLVILEHARKSHDSLEATIDEIRTKHGYNIFPITNEEIDQIYKDTLEWLKTL